MYRVLIVEDDPMVKSLYEIYIARSDQYKIVAAIDNANFAEIYCVNNQVDLILMDVCTSSGASGLHAAEKIKRSYPNVKIIIITSMPEFDFIKRAKECNVESFWYKESDEKKILDVMNRTMAGESIYPQSTPVLQLGLAKSSDFTRAEIEVLRELTSGDTDEQIAANLHLSPWTIRKYIKTMLEKTGFKSRTQLAVAARQSGIVIREY